MPLPAKPSHSPEAKRRFPFTAKSRFGGPNLARLVFGGLLLVLLAIVWSATDPVSVGGGRPSEWGSAVSKAAADNIVNGAQTSGAPQQSVVNGWYQNELSQIQTSQNTYIAASSARNGGLLGLLVLAVAGEIIIRAFERKPSQPAV
ncbi:hypothetical protein D7003_16220 [Arthrobacter oryzae]|uniref:Uncharacterized protein n=2 Tax=Arthrobacter oryzae TaxID=409290 RepID=A0A3N0BQS0_9MICC|nr:hypothetical protein D7003_16220 [Arthrobacter oryzae]